jgi:hypothetical protein
MDISQVKITVDIFLGMLVQYIRDISNDIHTLQKNNATHGELMEKQMELAELVHYYETTGILNALRVHWPAMNELFDRALKLRQDKDVIEELDYLRKVR